MLIVPRKRIWTQQPRQVALSSPSYKGILAWYPAWADRNAVSGGSVFTLINPESVPEGYRLDPYKGMVIPSFVGLGLISGAYINVTVEFTIDTLVNGFIFQIENRLNIGIGVESIPSGRLGVSYYDGAFKSVSTADFSAGVKYTLQCVVSTSGIKMWLNGALIGSANGGSVIFAGGVRSCAIGYNPFVDGGGARVTVHGLFISKNQSDELIQRSTPWQIFRAPDSHIFAPTGAGAGGGDSLTASNIIAAPATVGSPILSQQHTLSASSIATTPAIVASPAITQRHALSATAVSASPAVVGSPSITQRHALTATSISAGPAVVGSPTLTEIVAGVLSALPIVAAPAVVGAPAITQKHALSTGAISAGPATFGTPTLAQQHALMAQGVTAGAAVVGAPVLFEGGAAPFTTEQLLYLDANYVTIANINDIAAAVLTALQATAIPVNVKQVNDSTITGQGFAPPNHWRPA